MANILIGGVNLKTLGMHNGIANIKDYGGLANDTYDNYGITQALVDAWEALDGGTIVFPSSREGSRYRFTQGVVNDSVNVVNFSGTGASSRPETEGGNASVMWLDSDTDDAFLIKYAQTGASTGGMIVERLLLMGNSDSDGLGANQSGILFAGRCHNHQIRECGFRFFSGYAIAHDPTVSQAYGQNASIRNSHFWAVGGCFGPTEEYPPTGNYLFSTLYTLDNVGLDHSIGWGSWGHTPKPYIWDFRATRSVQSLGNFLIEGTGLAGQTACVALASGGASFNHIHYEITTNDPTYFFAIYGAFAGGQFNSSGEKRIKVGSISCEIVGVWFENSSVNESVVDIDRYSFYSADSVAEVVEWEDGINVNSSGKLTIQHLESKFPFQIPDIYKGRFTAGMTGADHASRVITVQNARQLMRWNAADGSLLGDWGEVVVEDTEASIDTHAIEADGNFLCHRFTGDSTFFFPRVKFRLRGDIYEGATVTIAIRYRCTIDAADSGITPLMYSTSAQIAQVERTGGADKNLADYSTGIASGVLLDGVVDPNRFFQWRANGGTPTVPVVLRMIAVEIWLGQPHDLILSPALVPQVPTFGAADATPSVTGHKTWKTGTSGLTITDFDDFPAGEERTIISKGAIVFDTTGTNLVGSSVDITTASGDITKWVSEDGTTKRLVGFVDVSIDNSAGA